MIVWMNIVENWSGFVFFARKYRISVTNSLRSLNYNWNICRKTETLFFIKISHVFPQKKKQQAKKKLLNINKMQRYLTLNKKKNNRVNSEWTNDIALCGFYDLRAFIKNKKKIAIFSTNYLFFHHFMMLPANGSLWFVQLHEQYSLLYFRSILVSFTN